MCINNKTKNWDENYQRKERGGDQENEGKWLICFVSKIEGMGISHFLEKGFH